MRFHPSERVAAFIDGVALYQTARALAFDIDYRRLLEAFSSRARLVRALYYTLLQEDQEYSPIRPLIDWLGYNGYGVVTRSAGEPHARRRGRGSMDVDMVVDMMELADSIDHVVLFAGEADLRRAVEAVQRRGVRVTVVSTLRAGTPMVAYELRRQADQFVDLADLAPLVAREQQRRDGGAERSGEGSPAA